MTGPLTSTAVIPPAVSAFYNKMLLRRALPKLVHMRIAQRKSLARRQGNTMVFRRVNELILATTPLLEGQPPDGQPLSHSDISVTIMQWGDFTILTDLEQIVVENDMLRAANKVLSEQSSQTTDVLARDVWVSGSSVFRGGNATLRTDLLNTTHKIDTALLDRMIRELANNNASTFTEMVDSSTKQATFPIRAAFWAITSPDVIFTAETLGGYHDITEYGGNGRTLEAEKGAYKHLRFLETTLAKKFLGAGGSAVGDIKATGGNADVHTILAFGEDAVASVPLEGHSLENIIKPTGSAGTADPLDQVATSGWKHTGARIRLQEAFMTRGEVTVGLLAP